jgi:hypothetical protein
VNQPIAHAVQAAPAASRQESKGDSVESLPDVPVGDVVVRRDDGGYGIFNYRGERVLDSPLRTAHDAERLAAEIVSPWKGRVRVDTTR